MTVRAKTEIYRALNAPGITQIWVKSNIVGELQVQAIGYDGTMQTVFVPSSIGLAEPRLVNLIDFASASSWRASRSLMAAVRMGHITVTLKKG
jgi:hypothetical protein